VAGARDSGKTALIAGLDRARQGDLSAVRARLTATGFEGDLADVLKMAEFLEVPGYTTSPGPDSARDRQTRREAVREATEADLLLLLIDAARIGNIGHDVRFVEAWQDWFAAHPGRECPPALAVVGHADRLLEPSERWEPPYDWLRGTRPLEVAIRAAVVALRTALPQVISDVVPVSLHPQAPYGVVERLLPDLAALLHRAERMALLRHLHSVAESSKARRLFRQVGRQGRRLWDTLRSPRKEAARS
jgi:predicted GTPase